MKQETAIEDFFASTGQNLEWVQPAAMQRRYELRGGGRVFGRLDFASAFGSLADAAASTGAWTFKRVGFFTTRVTVRRSGEEQELAVYHPRWTGDSGRLAFADGRAFTWKVSNFWATRYILSDEQDHTLITYISGREESRVADLLKVQAQVAVEPWAARLPDLPLLVMIGWYLILLHYEDSAVVAGTVGAGA